MTRHKSFVTAAFRRREDPIVWTIDDTEVHLRPSVDLATVLMLIDAVTQETGEGQSAMEAAIGKRATILDQIRQFIVLDSLPAFEQVQDDLDFATLGQMAKELISEYSGTGNPTRPGSSSDGSDTTGESSTAGVAPEASTPSDSPSIEA